MSAPLYLSALSIAAAIGGSLFLFREWIASGRKRAAFLFWTIALASLFVFQVPTVLFIAATHPYTVSDFNVFYAITLPLSFFGIIMEFFGVLALTRPISKRIYTIFTLWFFGAIAFFDYEFMPGKIVMSHAVPNTAIAGYFLPLNMIAFWAVSLLAIRTKINASRRLRLGLISIAFSFLAGLARNILMLEGFAKFPPMFWFLALQSPLFFALQLAGTAFLITGFLLVSRSEIFNGISRPDSGRG